MHVVPRGAAAVAVRLLGPLEVRGAGVVLGARQLGGGKPRQILEILLLDAGTTVSKARLVELLWSGRTPAGALATLESYVSVLRHHLLPVAGSRTALVRTAVGGYVIDRGAVAIDVDQLSPLVRQAQSGPRARAERSLQRVLEMTAAPLLADEPEAEWAEDARLNHARALTDVLVAAAETAVAVGAGLLAVRLADRALAGDPHSESAWAVKIAALDSVGLQADALRAYASCREVFANELGCTPGARVQDVFGRLVASAGRSDDELGHLVTAVVQVHAAASGPGGVDLGRLGHGTGLGSAEDACRALVELIRRARGPAVPLVLT